MKRRLLLLAALALAGGAYAIPLYAEDVVAVVSVRSPVTAISTAQLADIFLGKSNRFPDGTQAVPIDLNEDSPVRDRFYAQYAGKSPAQVKAHWSKIIFTGRGQPPRQAATASEAKKLIADNPNAIGYIDASQVDSSVRVLAAR
jgi:ABC-type phosphate transport system substrate-binding protein